MLGNGYVRESACSAITTRQAVHSIRKPSVRSPVRNQVRSLWDWSKAMATTAGALHSAPALLPAANEDAGTWLARDDVAMGTAIRVELWCEDVARGNAAACEVMAEMHRIDRTMSPHKDDSELSIINRDAARAPVALSNEMFLLLVQAQRFSQFSHGAFDITYASAGACTTTARAWRRAQPNSHKAAPPSAGKISSSTRARAVSGSRVLACASTSVVLPRATRWTTPPRS